MTNTSKKQKIDDQEEDKHGPANEEQKVLAIIKQKENLPKELCAVIEKYQQKESKSVNATNEFLNTFENRLFLILLKDIYRKGFDWCPRRVQAAMELFPDVLPHMFRDITKQHIRDKAKMVAVLGKTMELPIALRFAIIYFQADFSTESTVPNQFLEYMESRVRSLYAKPSQGCEYDPQEFETTFRLFPQVLEWGWERKNESHPIECLTNRRAIFCPKAFALVPMMLQVCFDLQISRGDVMSAALFNLLHFGEYKAEPNRVALVEVTCLSILEAIMNKELVSKKEMMDEIHHLICRSITDNWMDDHSKCKKRYRWLVKRYQWLAKSLSAEIRDGVFRDPLYQFFDFQYQMDAYLCLFPSEMGQLFKSGSDLYKEYKSRWRNWNPVVFELLEEHLVEAAQQTRIDMIVYAVSNELVPLKFLYFLLRREPNLVCYLGRATEFRTVS